MRNNNSMITLAIPSGTDALDVTIMRHVTEEIKGVVRDGISDMETYGSGEEYECMVYVEFNRKVGK